MARPIQRGSKGNWLLKVRVPADVADKVRGQVVLPVAGRRTPVAISAGYVEVSLRTSDADEAALRYTEAHEALLQHWKAIKAGPKPISKRQVVALSADAYRERISEIDDPSAVTSREAMNAQFDRFLAAYPHLSAEEQQAALEGWLEDLLDEQGADFIAILAAVIPGVFSAEKEVMALESRRSSPSAAPTPFLPMSRRPLSRPSAGWRRARCSTASGWQRPRRGR
jgi:hypothetical protein